MSKKTQTTVHLTCAPQEMDTQATLRIILDKLKGLDRVETKLDNINQRVEAVEERVAALENEQIEMAGALDVIQADIAADQKKVAVPVGEFAVKLREAENRIEELENSNRRHNIRILGWKPHNEEKDLCKQVGVWLNELTSQGDPLPLTVTKAYRITSPRMQTTARMVIATVQVQGHDDASQVIRRVNQRLARERKGQQPQERMLITDDVCMTTRGKRQRLMPRLKQL